MNDAWVNFAFGDGPGENEDDDDDRVGMATPAASSDHMSEAASEQEDIDEVGFVGNPVLLHAVVP